MAGSGTFKDLSIEVGLDEVADPQALRRAVARALRCADEAIPALVVKKRSLDARRRSVRFRLVVGEARPEEAEPAPAPPQEVAPDRRVVIVGDGPAGLFCSYELARHGIGSVIVERGRLVQPRRHDLAELNRSGTVDIDSNYCFGEGGAGTYSDGKLYTRAGKRGDLRDVLAVLVEHGAPSDILVDARPHIGSNLLPKVITALRERLESVGVEFRFQSRVTGFDLDPQRAVRGAVLRDGQVVPGEALVLATGHSARDVFDMLAAAGVELAPKAFAMGTRIEHPQPLIDEIQYGRAAGHANLPAASYRLAQEVDGRGVFSFCMCPGGWIVPAATESDGLVVNGMSLSRRDSPYANSGLVVSVEPEDVERAGFTGPLAGIALQRAVEQAAWLAGGGAQRAPATKVVDLLGKRGSSQVGACSYRPGIVAADLAASLDSGGLMLSHRLRTALQRFGGNLRGFLSDEALLVGIESRTSSPVRVVRRPDDLQSPSVAGLYPCGEGAGYAGGIISAALDGVRVARAIAAGW